MKPFITSLILCYILLLLCGVPFFSHYLETLTLSLTLTCLCGRSLVLRCGTTPHVYADLLYSDTLRDRQLVRRVVGTVGGAWVAAGLLALDWPATWYLEWPVPSVVGAMVGCGVITVF